VGQKCFSQTGKHETKLKIAELSLELSKPGGALMEESESKVRNNEESTIHFQGRKKQLKGTSLLIRKKKKKTNKKPAKANHSLDDFRNHVTAKKFKRRDII